MSYGPDFLSKDKVDKRTIRAKRSYSRRKVEGEGIVTSHLPAYTDVLKIRYILISQMTLVYAGCFTHFLTEKCMAVVYQSCEYAIQ